MTQSGTHLLLGGKPFRFGGANIEWLGLAGYGPAEIDKAVLDAVNRRLVVLAGQSGQI